MGKQIVDTLTKLFGGHNWDWKLILTCKSSSFGRQNIYLTEPVV